MNRPTLTAILPGRAAGVGRERRTPCTFEAHGSRGVPYPRCLMRRPRVPAGFPEVARACDAPAVPAPLQRAYADFRGLVAELLARGSRDRRRDLAQLRAELQRPDIRACVQQLVTAEEFGRIVVTVIAFGPERHPAVFLRCLWSPMRRSDASLVRRLGERVARGVLRLGRQPGSERIRRWLAARGWPVGRAAPPRPRRGRGHA
jgi:hypothetical protein